MAVGCGGSGVHGNLRDRGCTENHRARPISLPQGPLELLRPVRRQPQSHRARSLRQQSVLNPALIQTGSL